MTTPIIPYIGGKRKLAKKILPHFPEHTCYVEPFAGGLAMLLAKTPSKCEVVNDISNDLVCLYRVVQNHYSEFEKQFEFSLASRTQYQAMLKQDTALLTDIQKAARYFYLQKLGFGGNVVDRTFGTSTTAKARLNPKTLKTKVKQLHERLVRVTIEHLSWQAVLDKYDRPHTLFYCDPPYWQTAGYGVPFEWTHYEQLAEYMRNVDGMMIISINDHPDIRKLFADFRILPLTTTYTCGKQTAKANELLILNAHATQNLAS